MNESEAERFQPGDGVRIGLAVKPDPYPRADDGCGRPGGREGFAQGCQDFGLGAFALGFPFLLLFNPALMGN